MGDVCIVRERLAGGEGCGGCAHCEEENCDYLGVLNTGDC